MSEANNIPTPGSEGGPISRPSGDGLPPVGGGLQPPGGGDLVDPMPPAGGDRGDDTGGGLGEG